MPAVSVFYNGRVPFPTIRGNLVETNANKDCFTRRVCKMIQPLFCVKTYFKILVKELATLPQLVGLC